MAIETLRNIPAPEIVNLMGGSSSYVTAAHQTLQLTGAKTPQAILDAHEDGQRLLNSIPTPSTAEADSKMFNDVVIKAFNDKQDPLTSPEVTRAALMYIMSQAHTYRAVDASLARNLATTIANDPDTWTGMLKDQFNKALKSLTEAVTNQRAAQVTDFDTIGIRSLSASDAIAITKARDALDQFRAVFALWGTFAYRTEAFSNDRKLLPFITMTPDEYVETYFKAGMGNPEAKTLIYSIHYGDIWRHVTTGNTLIFRTPTQAQDLITEINTAAKKRGIDITK